MKQKTPVKAAPTAPSAQQWFVECSDTREVLELDKKRLGQMMRALRKNSGKSLREVADAIDFTAPFLSDCENGYRRLTIEALQLFINYCTK